jgi:preprotein translocase subunit SecE
VKLREHWVKALEEFSRVIAPSREETVRALVIDFFPLK